MGLPADSRARFQRGTMTAPAAPAVAIISERLWASAFDRRDDAIGKTMTASPFPQYGSLVSRRIRFTARPPLRRASRYVDSARADDARRGVGRSLGGSANRSWWSARDRPAAAGGLRWRTPSGRWARTTRRTGALSGHPVALVPVSRVFGAPDHRNVVVNETPMLGIIGAMSGLVLVGGCATLMAIVLVHYERRQMEFADSIGARGLPCAARSKTCGGVCVDHGWRRRCRRDGLTLGPSASAEPRFAERGEPRADRPRTRFRRVRRRGVCGHRRDDGRRRESAARALDAIGDRARVDRRARNRSAGISSCPPCDADPAHWRPRSSSWLRRGCSCEPWPTATAESAGFDTTHTVFVSADVVSPNSLNILLSAELARGTLKTQQDYAVAYKLALTPRWRASAHACRCSCLTPCGLLRASTRLPLGPPPLGADRVKDFRQPRILTVDSRVRTVNVGWMPIGVGDLSLLGVPVLSGRTLSATDDVGFEDVRPVVVTAAFARRRVGRWHRQLGRRSRSGSASAGPALSGRRRRRGPRGWIGMKFEREAVFQASTFNHPIYSLSVTLHAANPEALAPAIRRLITTVVPAASRVSVSTGRDLVEADLGRERLGAWFFSGFGSAGSRPSAWVGFSDSSPILAEVASTRVLASALRSARRAATSCGWR